jgi:transaldolase/glucose-6-phosphate isomerase
MTNPLIEIQQYGQSIWYDSIRRGLITSGELQRMVDDDGLLGVTSNPSIFEKALAGSPDYDQATKALVAQGDSDAKDIYERLAIGDIQLAADVLYPAYERTDGPFARGHRPRQCHDQSTGNARRPAGNSATDRRGHKYQRDVVVCRRYL